MDATKTMPDDTKLLQAIALAIGATYMVDHELTGYAEGYLLPGSEVVANPLLDDAHALQLAALCLIDIRYALSHVRAGDSRDGWQQPVSDGDRATATRRAIANAVGSDRKTGGWF